MYLTDHAACAGTPRGVPSSQTGLPGVVRTTLPARLHTRDSIYNWHAVTVYTTGICAQREMRRNECRFALRVSFHNLQDALRGNDFTFGKGIAFHFEANFVEDDAPSTMVCSIQPCSRRRRAHHV